VLAHIGFIGVSLLLLFAGAEALVRGSASLGLRAGLGPLVVGLTIVAFGTSSPELVVSINSALAGQGDLAVGNVLGSNSFNIAVILGLTALVCPIPVHQQILKVDAPVALLVALLLPLLLLNGALSRLEGLLLFAGILGYTAMNLALARRQPAATSDPGPALAAATPSGSVARDVAMVIGGLAVLVLGSRLLVDHSVAVATALGVSEAVIGLTIVAAGTSMPELATSLVAALRKQPDIAIGNVIGSNVFNVLGILGAAALVAPMQAPGVSMVDVGAVILFTLLLLPLLFTGRLLHRAEGVLLLALYGGYLFWLWPTAA
jgi:cation:H+ antiporter